MAFVTPVMGHWLEREDHVGDEGIPRISILLIIRNLIPKPPIYFCAVVSLNIHSFM